VVRGVFVTGTDTGVGKTVVSAALMHRYRHQFELRYWKPIQTGIEQDDDTETVRTLGCCQPGEILDEGVRLERPVSPHLAARLAGTTIHLQSLADLVLAGDPSVRWIVEGAGGVLVPVSDSETMIDLMGLLGLPILVVARASLGTINHTLLTLEALRRRSLDVAGVVMAGEGDRENRLAVERYGNVAVLGDLPRLQGPTGTELAAWAEASLDPQGRLVEWLG